MILAKERRNGTLPIPADIKARLNDMQRGSLARLEGFGWSIKFVRRPLFQEQVVVLVCPAGQFHAVLREDGTFDRDIDFLIR